MAPPSPRSKPHRSGSAPRSTGSRQGENPLVLGVTGLPASGKSTVAALFRAHGASVADADALAHEVLDRPAVLRRVEEALGEPLRDASGRADRPRIGSLVFGPGGGDALERLTAILHPEVRATPPSSSTHRIRSGGSARGAAAGAPRN
ncbi:MAG: dephospho-CoA kinase [Planctomycetota bacterium]|jgi:dephospho-CoA kinase